MSKDEMRGAEAWPPCYHSTVRTKRKEGENKKAESTYRGDNKESCQKYTLWLFIVVCVHVCQKKECKCDTFHQGRMLWFTPTHEAHRGQSSDKCWHLMKRSHVLLPCFILSLPLNFLFHFPLLYFYPSFCFPYVLFSGSLNPYPTSLPLTLWIFCSISSVALKWSNISFTCVMFWVCKRDVAQTKILLCFCANTNSKPDKQMSKNVWVNEALCF